jgi:hypothetical protein
MQRHKACIVALLLQLNAFNNGQKRGLSAQSNARAQIKTAKIKRFSPATFYKVLVTNTAFLTALQ